MRTFIEIEFSTKKFTEQALQFKKINFENQIKQDQNNQNAVYL